MIRTKQETRYRSNTDSDPPRTEKDSSKLGKAGKISTQDIQLSQTSNSAPHCSADSQTTPLQSNSTAQPPHGTTDDADDVEVCTSFDDMGLQESLLRGIYSLGFERPSKIQQRAVLPCCSGRDIIVQAQSGTGKTATFSIAVLQQLNLSLPQCQAIIVCPTRELSRQNHTVLLALGDYLNISTCLVVSGENVTDMAHRLQHGVHVVVGTPGRMKHMMEMRALDTRHVKILVLDEVDIMLSRGFEEQVRDIVTKLPGRNLQAISVSATLPPEVLQVTEKFMSSPVRILLKEEEIALDGILQFHVNVEREEHKFLTICDLYQVISITQMIIFCNSRRKVDRLAEYMKADDHSVSTIHSDLSPDCRKTIMREFKAGESRVLIGTDLVARGIDAQHVSVVCNVDLPKDKENYIHRIGRCGRFGRKGLAISVVTGEEMRGIRALEHHYKTNIPHLPHNVAELL